MEIRAETMRLYRKSNKTKVKGKYKDAPRVSFVEARLFLQDEPKFRGFGASNATQGTIYRSGDGTGGPASLAGQIDVGGPANGGPNGGSPSIAGTAAPPATHPRGPSSRAASAFARPVGVKKGKKIEKMEKAKCASIRLSTAVEGVSGDLRASSSSRSAAASIALQMKLIERAAFSEADKQDAYRRLLETTKALTPGPRAPNGSNNPQAPPSVTPSSNTPGSTPDSSAVGASNEAPGGEVTATVHVPVPFVMNDADDNGV